MAKRNGGIIGPSNVPTGQYGGVAPGVWRLRDAFNYIKAGLWPVAGNYPVGNSLRFNGGSTDYLNRTLGTSTSRRIYTMSAWVKRSKLDVYGHIFTFGPNPGSWDSLRFDNNNKLAMRINDDTYVLQTTQLFRDVSAWYHIVVAIDTTQATSSNRVKMYVNGSQITAFDTSSYPVQNYDTAFTSGNDFRIGLPTWNTSQNIDSYLSEAFTIDGQALDPTSFGQTDSATGIWIPKPYTGTYGTNGFYLKFANSASLGTDSSGNGNNFTVNNLTSIDQTTDTPTNNFATANPLVPSDSITYSNGNLTLTGSNSTNYSISNTPTFGVSKGKWYWEIKYTTANANQNSCIGVVNYDNYEYNQNITSGTRGYISLRFDGSIQINGVDTASYFTAPSAGDILMGAMDMDNGKVYFGNNGTWFNSGNPATSTNPASSILTSGTWTPVVRYLASVFEWNFGSPPFTIASGNADANGFGNFEYAVPSGYYALCTKNLADYG
jgi:hypothetical protein